MAFRIGPLAVTSTHHTAAVSTVDFQIGRICKAAAAWVSCIASGLRASVADKPFDPGKLELELLVFLAHRHLHCLFLNDYLRCGGMP